LAKPAAHVDLYLAGRVDRRRNLRSRRASLSRARVSAKNAAQGELTCGQPARITSRWGGSSNPPWSTSRIRHSRIFGFRWSRRYRRCCAWAASCAHMWGRVAGLATDPSEDDLSRAAT